MTLPPLNRIQKVHAHPIDKPPYNLLRFKRMHVDGNNKVKVPLYDVFYPSGKYFGEGGALEALRKAHSLSPGECWYCCSGVPLSAMHRDHVQPKAAGGEDRLYNLLISCPAHNTTKASTPISVFDPNAASLYLHALSRHLKELGDLFTAE